MSSLPWERTRFSPRNWWISVAAADENALSPSMAGFVLSDGSKANIIFAVNEGELTIVGINY